MKNHLAIAASCLLAGGGIGFLAGKSGSDTERAGEEGKAQKAIASSNSRRISEPRSQSGSATLPPRQGEMPRTYAEISALPGQTARLQALVALYSDLSSEEFAKEADQLDALPFNERILSAYILFASWGEKAPREAFEHANTKMGRTGMFVRPTILQSWASTDPNAAAQYYESHKSQFAMMGMMGRMGGGRGASSGADTVAGEWAKQDPDAALAWAGTLEGPDREDATKKVISQIASTDPQRAAALTSELSGAALSDVNTSIAAEWAKKDWSAAEGFISSLPADQQASALGAAVESLVAEQPDLAATKVLEIPEGAARDRAVRSLAKSMASEDPAAAVDWILANGSSDVQAEAVSDIMGNWVSVDASAAKDFATAQAEGPLRDSAVASYVLSDMEGDPVDHIELALSIGDDRARRRAIGATAMRWMSEDAEGATEYLSNSPGIDQKVVDWILNQRR